MASGGLRSVVLVFALLFCHGAFGFAHQLTPPDAAMASAGHSEHVAAGHGGQESGEHSVGGSYFATLLALVLGAFVLLVGRMPLGVRFRRSKFPQWRVPSVVFHPPRGPTVPMLGVFRL